LHFRLATFNVENLFERPKVMNLSSWSAGQETLNDYNALNSLLNNETYSEEDKKRMLVLLEKHGLLSTRPNDTYLDLVKIRGQLFKLKRGQPPEIVAKGRSDWVGWVELKKDAINDEAIKNTARVICEVNPDIIVLVEVEDRWALQHFHDQVLAPMMESSGHEKYAFNMVIDGNDSRGIDVGILSRYPIASMRSHITDKANDRTIFSRDCPEYSIKLQDGIEILVLPNHFASKGSDLKGKRRLIQSARVKEIYGDLKESHANIVVAGDLNDYPGGGSLDELLKGTDLKDAMSLPAYQGLPGTYEHANENQKLDYLLLSPALSSGVADVNVERRGFYAPKKWKSFDNINKETKDRNQASDHHCLWADIEL